MVDVVDPARLSGMVDWLEDENRQLKSQLAHHQELLEQALALLRDQSLRLRTLEDESGATRSQVSKIGSLEGNQQHAQEVIAQMQADQAQFRQSYEKMERDRQADNERHRVAMIELWQRLDYLRQEMEPVPTRLQTLADSGKRLHDSLFVAGKQVENIQHQVETLGGRAQLALDQAKKNEHDLAHWMSELEPLRRADEMLLTRIQIAGDAVKALSEQVNQVLAHEEQWREVGDRVEVARVDLQRADKELVEIRQIVEGHGERVIDLSKAILQAEARRDGLGVRLDEVQEELLALRLETERQFGESRALLERQARRQLAEFEVQTKEFRDRGVRAEKR